MDPYEHQHFEPGEETPRQRRQRLADVAKALRWDPVSQAQQAKAEREERTTQRQARRKLTAEEKRAAAAESQARVKERADRQREQDEARRQAAEMQASLPPPVARRPVSRRSVSAMLAALIALGSAAPTAER